MGLLTKREREFVQDWMKVVSGEIDKLEFYRKWSSRKDGATFLDDFEKVKAGEMSVEEFRKRLEEEIRKIGSEIIRKCRWVRDGYCTYWGMG